MYKIKNVQKFDIHKVEEDPFWNFGESKELLMHRIHSYPAKFPYFLIEKSLSYAKHKGISPQTIADVFCGCGTTALEAQKADISFWGCDINPVATLIARVKSNQYDEKILLEAKNGILETFKLIELDRYLLLNNERIKYWFSTEQILEIEKLLVSINKQPLELKYKDFFLCAVSNILKAASKWLTKSIKPQVDPNKRPIEVMKAFEQQFNLMIKANKESINNNIFHSNSTILTTNLLEHNFGSPIADMIITSPPYVTSYEYADLHQLSTLVLGYVEDYKELRKGTIGSDVGTELGLDYPLLLNDMGKDIYYKLQKIDKSKARSVARYFIDMKKSVQQTHKALNTNGLILFVIGNTNYKGIEIDNATILINSLHEQGFSNIEIIKRRISGKILTPYRDENGRFANSGIGKKVYSHEYIVMANK